MRPKKTENQQESQKFFRKILCAACSSALLLILAFDFAPFPIACLFCMLPWLWFLVDEKCLPKQGFYSGLNFGATFLILQFFFIFQLVRQWTGSAIVAVVPWLLAAFLGSLFFGLFGWLAVHLRIQNKVWAIPLLWASVEIFRSYIPVLAFPWGLLATPLSEIPILAGAGHFVTIYGFDAGIIGLNLFLITLVKTSMCAKARSMILYFYLPIFSLANFLLPSPTNQLLVSVGQLGVNSGFGDPTLTIPELHEATKLAESDAIRAQSRLLVLPEAVARIPYPSLPSPGFPVSSELPIVFGAQRGLGTVYQSAFSFDGKWHFMDKSRLVIFGEFVPGRSWIPYPSAFDLPSGDITSGKSVESLVSGNLTLGPLICFEGLFPDISYKQSLNHAQILTLLSEEDWFNGSTALRQLRDASLWRAIETGLPLLRASTTGYSLIADGKGHVLVQASLESRKTLTTSVSYPEHPLPPFWLAFFPTISLLLTGYSLVSRKKT